MKKLNPDTLPCKFAHNWHEDVAGDGGSRMPMFECAYDGEIEIPPDMICFEDKRCPAFCPPEIFVCKKHNEEFTDFCNSCMTEQTNEESYQETKREILAEIDKAIGNVSEN